MCSHHALQSRGTSRKQTPGQADLLRFHSFIVCVVLRISKSLPNAIFLSVSLTLLDFDGPILAVLNRYGTLVPKLVITRSGFSLEFSQIETSYF